MGSPGRLSPNDCERVIVSSVDNGDCSEVRSGPFALWKHRNITTLHCQASFACVRSARARLYFVEEGLELSEIGFDLGEINTLIGA